MCRACTCCTSAFMLVGLFTTSLLSAEPVPVVDRWSDPLVEGAKARMGTQRYRAAENLHACTISPDGKVVAGFNHRAMLWIVDTASGKEVRRMVPSAYFANFADIAITTRGNIITSNYAEDLQVWDVGTGKQLRRLQGAERTSVAGFSSSADGSKVAGVWRDIHSTYRVRVWDADEGTQLCEFQPRHSNLVQLHLSADGKLLATWGVDQGSQSSKEVDLRDPVSGKLLRTIETDLGGMRKATLSADGKYLAFVVGTSTIVVCDTSTGKVVQHLAGIRGSGYYLRFTPDGKEIWAGTENGEFLAWEVASGVRSARWAISGVHHITFAFPPGDVKPITCGLTGGTVRLFEARTGTPLFNDDGHTGPVTGVVFLNGDKELATAGADGTVRFWEIASGKNARPTQSLEAYHTYSRNGTQHPSHAALTLDGNRLLIVPPSNLPTVIDTTTGKNSIEFSRQRSHDLPWTISRDGKSAVCCCSVPTKTSQYRNVAYLWDVFHGRELRTLGEIEGWVPYVTLSGDGRYAYVAATTTNVQGSTPGNEQRIKCWDTETGKEVWSSISYYPAQITGLGCSSDGSTVVVGMQNALMVFRDPSPGVLPQTIAWKDRNYSLNGPIRFAPDGRSFALVSYPVRDDTESRRRIVVWETLSLTPRREFPGHQHAIADCAFSSNSRLLASASHDTTVLLWELLDLGNGEAVKKPSEEQLTRLFERLKEPPADDSYSATVALLRTPKETVDFLGRKLKPADTSVPSPDEITRWIGQLDADDFGTREQASQSLKACLPLAERALRKALLNTKSPEQTERIKVLLDKAGLREVNREELRKLRCLEILEHLKSSEARELVQKLTKGKAGVALTVEAEATLRRMK